MEKIAQEYVLIEFSEEKAAYLLKFLENYFFKKKNVSWEGSVVVLEMNLETKELTVADLFCEYEDQKILWDDFRSFICENRRVS